MRKYGLVLLILICGLIGCMSNRITKLYDFSSPVKVVEHKDLTVVATLNGTYSSGEKQGRHNVTVVKNPYEALVQIKTVSFYYKSSKIIHFRIEDERGRPVPKPRGAHFPQSDFLEVQHGYMAELSMPGFQLSHEAHRLVLDIQILTRANAIEDLSLVFWFTPQYKEEKTNDTWEKVGGK